MGSTLSYVRQLSKSSRVESEVFLSSTPDIERGMAEASNPRDAETQHNLNKGFSRDEYGKYQNALQVCLEFLHRSGNVLERQRIMETDLETCQERLKRFREDHARVSESGTENISSPNRPSALERNYKSFYDHERMDAIDHIEKSRKKRESNLSTGIEDQRIACFIFEESFAAAQTLRENFLEGISWILRSAPTMGAQYAEGKTTKELQLSLKTDRRQVKPLRPSDMNSLIVILKETAESCDVSAISERVYSALIRRQESNKFSNYKKNFFMEEVMTTYVDKCCRYVWKLVCQTSPYVMQGDSYIQKSDKIFSPDFHEVCRESATTEHRSGLINFVVWPGLFERNSVRVISKTEVVLR